MADNNRVNKMRKTFDGFFSDQSAKEELLKASAPVSKDADSDEKKFIRMTYIVDANANKKMKMIAAKEGIKVKDVLDQALSSYLSLYEAKNGAL